MLPRRATAHCCHAATLLLAVALLLDGASSFQGRRLHQSATTQHVHWVDPKNPEANSTNVLVCHYDLKNDTARHEDDDDHNEIMNWHYYWRGNAYVLVDQDVPGSFSDCVASCAFKTAPGFTVLTIGSKEENKAVATLLSNTHMYNCTTGLGRAAWLGVTDFLEEGRMTYFINGSDLGFHMWAKGQPNNAEEGQDCVRTLKSGTLAGGWEDIQCDRVWAVQQLCMCKHDGGVTPHDAVYLGDSGHGVHFWGLRSLRSWEGCRVGCYKEVPSGVGRMTLPKTQLHWRKLHNVAGTHVANLGANHVWIGATDMVREGVWTWTDKSPVLYAPWAAGQPDNVNSTRGSQDEDCALMAVQDGSYTDEWCGRLGACVCEGPPQS